MIRSTWLAVLGLVLAAGCGSSDPAPRGDTAVLSDGSAGEVPTPVAVTPGQCQQWTDALRGFSEKMILASQFLKTDDAYAQQSDPTLNEAFRIDVALLRSQIEVISTIPDPSETSSLGKPSEVIPKLKEMADLLEANLKSGKPFSDGAGHGEKLIELLNEINLSGRIALSMALEQAGCKM